MLPLGTQRVGPFPFASLCGGYFPSRGIPYCGAPDRLAPACEAALRAMKAKVGLRLGPVPHDDAMLTALLPALERGGWRLLRQRVGVEFVLKNPGGLEAYQAGLSSNRRKKVDYYWRKLNEAGKTELRHFNGAGCDWPSVFADIRAVEAASWVAQTGEPRFLGARNERYWNQLMDDPWFNQAVNVWLIDHCGTPVSFALTLDSGSTRYVIANSFDERVAKFSTGSKIYQQLIFDAFGRGLSQVNIGLGDSGYKSGWGARPASTLIDVIAFAPSLGGRTALLAARAREAAAQIRKRRSRSRRK
ncbi:GNAT family N-acetyltransferase [Pedomonas mirosovicensis]|uniref:GNAT family N-acetyltransferase n=1 Tax=Pedomonas mirosovicensis TaxID=2908641 RepID=UPI002167CB40|nr:GNAT family N-acetyltransferase [Pedomonas mirosovicensis]MCH8683872.1 GNAT family N-acetyltransferase [Pedomonas mirosovicensis]